MGDYPEVVKRMLAADRRWFRDHPRALCRFRAPAQGEMEHYATSESMQETYETLAELVELLSTDKWRLSIVVASLHVAKNVAIPVPALEIFDGKRHRNALVWTLEDESWAEISPEQLVRFMKEGARLIEDAAVGDTITATPICTGCKEYIPPLRIGCLIKGELYCGECTLNQVKKGIKSNVIQVGVIGDQDGKCTSEHHMKALDFRRMLQHFF